jgi:hypothetical protein
MKTSSRVLVGGVTHAVYEPETLMFAGKTVCLVLFTLSGHVEFSAAKLTWRVVDCMTCLVLGARV